MSGPRLPDARPWLGWRRPDAATLTAVLAANAASPLSYPHAGATWEAMPAGWSTSERWIDLGGEPETWGRARQALESWAQFDLEWVAPFRRDVPLEPGALFAFSSRQYGAWTINVCRIVRVVDEADGGLRRYGFSYGTVGSHVLRGEERFVVEADPSGRVRFGIRRFSRPSGWWVSLAGPLVRRAQDTFLEDAIHRFAREVRHG